MTRRKGTEEEEEGNCLRETALMLYTVDRGKEGVRDSRLIYRSQCMDSPVY